MKTNYSIWGSEIDQEVLAQIENACNLPVSVRGALMPDCHLGYGLPIGGVLATENAVIPYAVGVDISCSMNITLLDIPISKFSEQTDLFRNALERETRFGVGAEFNSSEVRNHSVMEEDWNISPVTKELKDKAWKQLGSSGSGNHFVEFGIFTTKDNTKGIPPGEYLALLSHSGSRGVGAAVCNHYSKLATQNCPDLPSEMKHLSWLSMDSQEGQEYWAAMNLMNKYALANHELIHKHIREALSTQVVFTCYNSHNLAWKEIHDGRELIVHRKGATPAEKGELGLIAGSMTSSTYLVEGKGNEDALKTCSHGAGRKMSRKRAKKSFNWADCKAHLQAEGVELLSGGLDEMPGAYKDIHAVMAAQQDLVSTVGLFQPKMVKMARDGRG